ncbi:MAG: hypothetical protein IT379_13135 [Deltaproteobacteria bacterium]|nr:hypothetical protein [Deltaproteobacteria bacterium]
MKQRMRWMLGASLLVGCTTEPRGASQGGKVYVAEEGSGSIAVLDIQTNALLTSVTLDDPSTGATFAPHNVQVAPDGRSVWVTAPPAEPEGEDHGGGGHGGAPEPSEQVIVLDPVTDTIAARLDVGSGLHLAHVILDPESRFAYATSNEASSVLRIDAGSRRVVARYELGEDRMPHGLRFCAGRLFVANMDGKSVSVVAPETGESEEVPLGGIAVQTACSPDGRFAFVSLYDTREVVRLETSSLTVERTSLPDGSQGPVQLYPSPDGRRLYVCDQGNLLGRPPSNRLYELDVESMSVVATIEVGRGAHGVVVSDDGAYAYVTNIVDGTVSVVDTETRSVWATLDVGEAPNGVSHWHVTGGMP